MRAIAIVALLAGAVAIHAFAEPVPQSPLEVWAGFDPRAEPLEVEMLREWTDAGANWREFYFTGETWDGEKVRIYAMYAAPSGGDKLPGILHIHGGGQTVSPEWLRFWTKRGYAALTFNWGGRWENRERFALWGKLAHCNHLDAKGGRQMDPTVRHSSWYHWTLVSRRALTALEQQPEVDVDRLGIFGISMGGTIVWPFTAMDNRVKVACAVYGNGWSTYPGFGAAGDRVIDLPDKSLELWRKTMEPESYAPFITCPLLFLSATNDFHGLMDRAYDSLARVQGPYRQAFTPKYNHHIDPEEGANLPLWMDHWLKDGPAWPESPRVSLNNESGRLTMRVEPDSAHKVKRIRMYYALENDFPITRFWRDAVPSLDTPRSANLDVLDPTKPVFAFANVTYESGVCLSSNLAQVVPAEIGVSQPTTGPTLLIDDFSDGYRDWVFVPAYTDPTEDWTYLRTAVGPGGVPALTLNPAKIRRSFHIGTHKIGDPQWTPPPGASLRFRILAGQPNTLYVDVMDREWRFKAGKYTATTEIRGEAHWQLISLRLSDFTDKDGNKLSSWNSVKRLELRSDSWAGEPPLLARVEWLRP